MMKWRQTNYSTSYIQQSQPTNTSQVCTSHVHLNNGKRKTYVSTACYTLQLAVMVAGIVLVEYSMWLKNIVRVVPVTSALKRPVHSSLYKPVHNKLPTSTYFGEFKLKMKKKEEVVISAFLSSESKVV